MNVRAELRSAAAGSEPVRVDMPESGDQYTFLWTPAAAGDYTVVVQATGVDGDGRPFERLAVLGVPVTE